MKQADFFAHYAPMAQAAAAKYHIPASVTLAQAALESSWGTSLLSRAPFYNFFGVKASKGAPSIRLSTTEYENGQPVTRVCAFRKYPSVAASFADHGRLLAESRYYAKARSFLPTNDIPGFVRAMGAVYATDPEYAGKLLHLMNEYHLWKYDTSTTAPKS